MIRSAVVSMVVLLVTGALQAGCGPGGGAGGGSGGGTTGSAGTGAGAGTTGAGGSVGSGGMAGGAAGRGGGSGTSGSGSADCFPPCIANARVGCWRPATGTCMYQSGGGNTNYCFSNGVKEVVGPLNKVHTFSTASGTCFSFEDVSPAASATTEVVFRNGAGMEIARGTHPFATFVWTITCGGQTYTVDESSAACKTVNLADCTQGSCP